MKESFFNLNFTDLSYLLKVNNLNLTANSILFNHFYKKKQIDFSFEYVSKETRNLLIENYSFELPVISKVHESIDGTVKFLFELEDKNQIETVLIPFYNKYSICISSQVGCAMKCSFCYTGTQGLKRNLTTAEIIGQFLVAWKWLDEFRSEGPRILNIVFMGQGEPLHNFDNVKKACEIFLSKYGFSLGAKKITISTSGFLPGLKRWVNEIPGVNLALSLHSPFMDKRDELIPINRKYPLAEVMDLIDTIPLVKKQFIIYEYLLIADFNDAKEDADALGQLIQGKSAYVNLIPFNPFPGSKYKRPDISVVENFKKILDSYKIPTLIRGTKGDDVLAACGQLKSN